MSPLPRLYWITDSGTYGKDNILKRLEILLDQGLLMIQVREKHLTEAALRQFIDEILRKTRPYDTIIILNGSPELVMEYELAGCHFPESAFQARKINLPESFISGCSLHSAASVKRLTPSLAAYCSLSPVYSPGSKSSPASPLGITQLREACQDSSVPVFALGGITLARLTTVLETGCYGVAFISELIERENFQEIMRILSDCFSPSSIGRGPG